MIGHHLMGLLHIWEWFSWWLVIWGLSNDHRFVNQQGYHMFWHEQYMRIWYRNTTATTHIPVQASWKLSAKGSCNQITSETCCFYPQTISINQSTTFPAPLPPQIASQSTLLPSDPRKYPVSIAGPRSPEDWFDPRLPDLPGCHVNNKVNGKPIQLLSCTYLMTLDISHQDKNTLPSPLIDGVFECGFIYVHLPYPISHHPTSASASPIISNSFPAWFWSCLMCNALLSARNWAKRSRTLVVV